MTAQLLDELRIPLRGPDRRGMAERRKPATPPITKPISSS